jgi:hypothetical protein
MEKRAVIAVSEGAWIRSTFIAWAAIQVAEERGVDWDAISKAWSVAPPVQEPEG